MSRVKSTSGRGGEKETLAYSLMKFSQKPHVNEEMLVRCRAQGTANDEVFGQVLHPANVYNFSWTMLIYLIDILGGLSSEKRALFPHRFA